MPDDPTPHGGEALHQLPDRARIPEPKPGEQASGLPMTEASKPLSAAEVEKRPSLPEQPELMAADVEDEDADPVIESSPDAAEDTGKPSVTQQPA